jgi:formylmethanofuran dehydrogenase subunit E
MPRIKEKRICIRCGEVFFRHNGNVKAKYCSRVCACRDRNTKEHQAIAGKSGGAVKIKLRGTGKIGYIKELGRHQHRVVMEKEIGRKLKSNEVVHHKDGNKHNNNIDNLELTNQSNHAREHGKNRYKEEGTFPFSKRGSRVS